MKISTLSNKKYLACCTFGFVCLFLFSLNASAQQSDPINSNVKTLQKTSSTESQEKINGTAVGNDNIKLLNGVQRCYH